MLLHLVRLYMYVEHKRWRALSQASPGRSEEAAKASEEDPETAVGAVENSSVVEWRVEDFLCDMPGCGRLLEDPVILNCGKVVCGTTCR
jgi:hypothetical protein